MLAYHNDENLKKEVLAEMAMHRKADSLVQGYGYWSDGKGCAVGCLIKSRNHAEYEIRFGIPRLLAHLEDGIFEGLSKEEAQKWPEHFLKAIRPGADLSMVSYKFMHWLLVDPDNGVIKFALAEKLKTAIKNVADLYARHIAGEKIEKAEWQKVRAARAAARARAAYAYAYAYARAAARARAADAYAADAYAYAADAYADAYASADAAARAASAAASAAADAAADAAASAAASARKSARLKQANKLIELLKEA